jgi:hypothetical protein
MNAKQRTVSRLSWHLICGLALMLSGCQPTAEFSTFVQDFARQALAAFLL